MTSLFIFALETWEVVLLEVEVEVESIFTKSCTKQAQSDLRSSFYDFQESFFRTQIFFDAAGVSDQRPGPGLRPMLWLWDRRGNFFNLNLEIRSHGESNPGPEECYRSQLTNSSRGPFANELV